MGQDNLWGFKVRLGQLKRERSPPKIVSKMENMRVQLPGEETG